MVRLYNLSVLQLILINRLWLGHGIYLLLICTIQIHLKYDTLLAPRKASFKVSHFFSSSQSWRWCKIRHALAQFEDTAWSHSKDQALSLQCTVLSHGTSHPTWTRHLPAPWREYWSDHLWGWREKGRQSWGLGESSFWGSEEGSGKEAGPELEDPGWCLQNSTPPNHGNWNTLQTTLSCSVVERALDFQPNLGLSSVCASYQL